MHVEILTVHVCHACHNTPHRRSNDLGDGNHGHSSRRRNSRNIYRRPYCGFLCQYSMGEAIEPI
jgi:hypothetical protein